MSDTVGFIQKLSPSVVAAFRATLEELNESDILLHVIDVTHPKAQEQTLVVQKTLEELGLEDRPRLLVMNKMDLMSVQDSERADNVDSTVQSGRPIHEVSSGILVSAAKGWNLDHLLREVEELLISIDGPLTVVGSVGTN